MYQKRLVSSLSALVLRNAQAHLLLRNSRNPKIATRDVKQYRPFVTTTLRRFSTEHLQKVDFEDVKKFANDKNIVIIDVREPNELKEHGTLPGSINIPLGEIEETLKNMSTDQFLKKYGCCKPDEETPLVFSCMRGIRSEKAQIVALQLGYKNVKNYLGGWVDWAEKNKN